MLAASECPMKSETIQTYKSPRWIILYVSLAMMVVGYIGFHVFQYISHLRHEKLGDNDVLALLSAYFGLLGGFLCLISGLWIVIVAIFSLFHRNHSKQV